MRVQHVPQGVSSGFAAFIRMMPGVLDHTSTRDAAIDLFSSTFVIRKCDSYLVNGISSFFGKIVNYKPDFTEIPEQGSGRPDRIVDQFRRRMSSPACD